MKKICEEASTALCQDNNRTKEQLPRSIHPEIEFILKQQILGLIDLLKNLMINALDLSKSLKGLVDRHINSNFQNHGKAYTLFSMNHISLPINLHNFHNR